MGCNGIQIQDKLNSKIYFSDLRENCVDLDSEDGRDSLETISAGWHEGVQGTPTAESYSPGIKVGLFTVSRIPPFRLRFGNVGNGKIEKQPQCGSFEPGDDV